MTRRNRPSFSETASCSVSVALILRRRSSRSGGSVEVGNCAGPTVATSSQISVEAIRMDAGILIVHAGQIFRHQLPRCTAVCNTVGDSHAAIGTASEKDALM